LKMNVSPIFSLSANQEVLGVSALTQRIKEHIESEFSGVWVQGEVTNLARAAAGHHYFSLKEGDALLKAVLFKGRARFFVKHLKEGAEVVCYGDISVYQPRGDYQLIVDFVEPAGVGALYAQLEYLKQRLQAEGLFDLQRKRPLPPLPKTVALLASHAGAALQDMLKVLKAFPLPLQVLVYPIASQGNEAPYSIVRAFEAVKRHGKAELVVLARGGGSVEDLWAFNDEGVVRAVASSPVPVITGIGHEIDTTLADLAADLRAPTPTAEAEVLVANAREVVNGLFELKGSMAERWDARLHDLKRGLNLHRTRLEAMDPRRRLREQRLHLLRLSSHMVQLQERIVTGCKGRLVEMGYRVERSSPLLRVGRARDGVFRLQKELTQRIVMRLERERHRVNLLNEGLRGVDPMAPLGRGYVLCLKGQSLVRSAEELTRGDEVLLGFASDSARCEVVDIHPREEES
jgi:exodeoxyribonuclease VII large subunit